MIEVISITSFYRFNKKEYLLLSNRPIELNGVVVSDDKQERWDGANVHDFRGTYGDYVLYKVSKVTTEAQRPRS